MSSMACSPFQMRHGRHIDVFDLGLLVDVVEDLDEGFREGSTINDGFVDYVGFVASGTWIFLVSFMKSIWILISLFCDHMGGDEDVYGDEVKEGDNEGVKYKRNIFILFHNL